MRRYWLNLGLIVLLATTSPPLLAWDAATTEADAKYYKEVQGRIDKVRTEKQALSGAIEAGQDRTVFCRSCHGKDGVATRPNVPNLAGQNALYLYTQLERFSDGRRYDFMMAGLAQSLTKDEILSIALFYSALPAMTADAVNLQSTASGKGIYLVRCIACHQNNAYGTGNIPRLAGQQPSYIEKVLREFRKSTGRRSGTEMTAIATGLSDQEISALASYLAGLE